MTIDGVAPVAAPTTTSAAPAAPTTIGTSRARCHRRQASGDTASTTSSVGRRSIAASETGEAGAGEHLEAVGAGQRNRPHGGRTVRRHAGLDAASW